MVSVRTRIAPSPTGEDLHIGNVYTALLNYVFAKKHKGAFIVRLEDTDRTRFIEGSEQRILSSLRWLGLHPDEAPDIGGPYSPYRQSERKDMYLSYAQQLVDAGHAYYCFCTPQTLTAMRERQKANGEQVLYDGSCKHLSSEDVQRKKETEPWVIRLNVPDDGVTSFHDLIRGEISFENKLIDDQVLIKSDGFPTYHLGVVVDDHCMKISHIIRAEEWISSTPKHVLLYNAFGWEIPIFAHGPILRNPDKSKLSKRKNPVWASWYKDQGYLPEAILNYLGLMGWSMPQEAGKEEQEIFTLQEMMKVFDLKDIRPVGPAFDLKKLEWMNGEYIRQLKMETLKSKIIEFIGKEYPEDIVEKTIPLIQERIKKLSDYIPLCLFFFEKPHAYEIEVSSETSMLTSVYEALSSCEIWDAENIGAVLIKTAQDLGIKNSHFFMVLRVSITGKKISPPLNESLEILGKKEVLSRLCI